MLSSKRRSRSVDYTHTRVSVLCCSSQREGRGRRGAHLSNKSIFSSLRQHSVSSSRLPRIRRCLQSERITRPSTLLRPRPLLQLIHHTFPLLLFLLKPQSLRKQRQLPRTHQALRRSSLTPCASTVCSFPLELSLLPSAGGGGGGNAGRGEGSGVVRRDGEGDEG